VGLALQILTLYIWYVPGSLYSVFKGHYLSDQYVCCLINCVFGLKATLASARGEMMVVSSASVLAIPTPVRLHLDGMRSLSTRALTLKTARSSGRMHGQVLTKLETQLQSRTQLSLG